MVWLLSVYVQLLSCRWSCCPFRGEVLYPPPQPFGDFPWLLPSVCSWTESFPLSLVWVCCLQKPPTLSPLSSDRAARDSQTLDCRPALPSVSHMIWLQNVSNCLCDDAGFPPITRPAGAGMWNTTLIVGLWNGPESPAFEKGGEAPMTANCVSWPASFTHCECLLLGGKINTVDWIRACNFPIWCFFSGKTNYSKRNVNCYSGIVFRKLSLIKSLMCSLVIRSTS